MEWSNFGESCPELARKLQKSGYSAWLSPNEDQVIRFSDDCLKLKCVHNNNIVWIHEKEKISWKKTNGTCKCLPNQLDSIVVFG